MTGEGGADGARLRSLLVGATTSPREIEMRKTNRLKKLTLDRDTVRDLTTQLVAVKGGVVTETMYMCVTGAGPCVTECTFIASQCPC